MSFKIFLIINHLGPHVDNVDAFDDFIVSLSLISSVLMEFKHKERREHARVLLEPNSLLVMKGESRFTWTHCIPERKHDIITSADNGIEVRQRQKRISLTFRKVLEQKSSSYSKITNRTTLDGEDKNEEAIKQKSLVLPKTDQEAVEFERSHVHEVYNQIAPHFSETRHSAWPGVANFIAAMPSHSIMLDVGCGNGKYLGLRSDLLSVS